ncbi:MAG: hypothetical protein WKF73_00815 [Nocardioidaceae bacterium]
MATVATLAPLTARDEECVGPHAAATRSGGRRVDRLEELTWALRWD